VRGILTTLTGAFFIGVFGSNIAAQQSTLLDIGAQRTLEPASVAKRQNVSATSSDFDILSCPFAIFREAYLGVFDTADRLAIMALEDEAISACAKRQAKVNLVLTQEKELRELLVQGQEETDQTVDNRANAVTPTAIEPATDQKVQIDAVENSAANTNQEALLAQMKRAVKEAQESCTFEYGVETAGHQLSGDGHFAWATLKRNDGQIFVVKNGDLLPGDLRVLKVSKGSVIVQSADGASRQLPVASFEHAEAIDLNVSYSLTPVAELHKQKGDTD
jgi:hypothetical protein